MKKLLFLEKKPENIWKKPKDITIFALLIKPKITQYENQSYSIPYDCPAGTFVLCGIGQACRTYLRTG
jgi:hypothetical protein